MIRKKKTHTHARTHARTLGLDSLRWRATKWSSVFVCYIFVRSGKRLPFKSLIHSQITVYNRAQANFWRFIIHKTCCLQRKTENAYAESCSSHAIRTSTHSLADGDVSKIRSTHKEDIRINIFLTYFKRQEKGGFQLLPRRNCDMSVTWLTHISKVRSTVPL